MNEIETGPVSEPERWAARPFLLAGLGLATGLVVHLILGGDLGDFAFTTPQGALAVGVTVGAALIGFIIERRDWRAALAFGVTMGTVAGLVTLWNGSPAGWGGDKGATWQTISLLVAVAIAAPLFQAAREEGTVRPSYPAVHDHLWANVVLWFASWAFVGLVLLMSFLLASLFRLIKIDLLHDLLMENWFWRCLVGLAFGSALGVLREHDTVVRMLQRVITMLLAVLAPVLAIGLGLFLFALPFTGVQALWEATSATTPLLLTCAAGALILANDVIGARVADERRMPLLRYAAMVLAAVILPLGGLAAVATGLRIGQYGYTPERLWAVVFVGIACLWGAAYLVALARGRLRWTERVRPANLVLAALICALGFVLATPMVSFNAISTRDQVARLESGRTTPEKFDWRALAFDFGEPGKAALKRLSAARNSVIRDRAAAAATAKYPYELADGSSWGERVATLDERLRVLPAGSALPPELRKLLTTTSNCRDDDNCTLMLFDREAVLLVDHCFPAPTDEARFGWEREYCDPRARYQLADGEWTEAQTDDRVENGDRERAAKAAGYKAGQIEIRKVERRQLFIGGVPVGRAFE